MANKQVIGVAEIHEDELAIRIMEACIEMKRPEGQSAEDAFSQISPFHAASFHRAARAAMLYWQECINNQNKVQ